jgi:hypothetical protein
VNTHGEKLLYGVEPFPMLTVVEALLITMFAVGLTVTIVVPVAGHPELLVASTV